MSVMHVAIVLTEASRTTIHWPANGLLGSSIDFTVTDTDAGGGGVVTVNAEVPVLPRYVVLEGEYLPVIVTVPAVAEVGAVYVIVQAPVPSIVHADDWLNEPPAPPSSNVT